MRDFRLGVAFPAIALVAAFGAAADAAQGWATGNPERAARGKAIYDVACAMCHGIDGVGNPGWQSDIRPVELSDCGTTAEPTQLWHTIVREGGASRGLSSIMPAFGEAYDQEEIEAVVAYMRTFCEGADRYPPGDLNFRRLLATGKAFPEMEWVLLAGYRPDAETRETELEVVYENRLGPRFQYEFEVPLRVQAREDGVGAGLGDVTLSGKQVLFFDHARLQILSGGLDVVLPTGEGDAGLGSTVSFAPFLAYGHAWGGGRSIFQTRLGVGLPVDGEKGNTTGRYAFAFAQALGPTRIAWTPAVELVGRYDFETKQREYGVWLELSKPLNKLGHVIANVGIELPIRPSDAATRLHFYVLWDFGDGPLWVGW